MQVLTYLQNLILTHWQVILSYLGAGGGVSVILQFMKRLRKWESTAWVELVLAIMTTIASAANYIVNHYITSPLPTIFGNFAPKILLAALVMHRIAVSPLFKLIEKKFGPWVTDVVTTFRQLRADKKVPVAPNPTTTFES